MVSRNAHAAVLIALNAVIDAFAFLWISGIVVEMPVASAVVWILLGAAAGAAGALAVFDPATLTHRQFWRHPLRWAADRDFVLYTISRLDWPMVAAAAALIGGLSTAIIVGTQNLIFIPLLHKMTSSPEAARWRRVGRRRFLLVAAAFVGAALAIVAQHDPADASTFAAGVAQTAAGSALAAAAAVFAALSASRFPLAIKMHEQLAVPAEGHTKEIAPMLLVHCAACVAAAAVLCVMFGLPDLVGAAHAAAFGFVAITAGLLTRSLGCLMATDLSVDAISYATPLVAFVLFRVTGAAADVDTAMIAAAAVLIVGSNTALALTTRPQR